MTAERTGEVDDTPSTIGSLADWLSMLEAGVPRGPDVAEITAGLVARFPELADVAVTEPEVVGPHGDVPARLYRQPDVEATAALVWAHGGAFVAGDLDMAEAHWVGLALAARGVPVLSIDYRKVLRGVTYPVPSDDVLAAWRWAVDHAEQMGVDAAALHIGGASAGSALVAGVTKRLRDGAGRSPASVVLVYPLVHPEIPPKSDAVRAATAGMSGVRFSKTFIRDLSRHFVGADGDLDDPHAFAGNGDVSGQPPIFILNAEADDLRPSGERYAEQLAAAGVPVRMELEPGTSHGHLNEPGTDGAWRSIDRMVAWLTAQ